MQLVVFGATGKTGLGLIKLALAGGHSVTAFARTPSKLRGYRVRVFKGAVTEPIAVSHAVKGQDAVLCVLGQRAPFERDPELTIGMRNILQAMQEHDVRRFVYLSFAGVPEGRRRGGVLLNWVLAPLLFNVAAGHAEREAWIKLSEVDWTMVRPVMLSDRPHTGKYRYGQHIRPTSFLPRIGRPDVADLMLHVLNDRSTFHKGLQVMY